MTFAQRFKTSLATRRTTIEGAVLLASGLIGIVESLRLIVFKNRASIEDFTGPGRYLFVISLLLALVGAVLIALARRFPEAAPARGIEDADSNRALLAIVAVLGLYIFLLDIIGYFLATQVFFLLILRVLGLQFGLRMILIGAAMGAGFYLLFIRLFGMSFPKGLIFS